MTKRYDELKVNDIIWWHGAKVRVTDVQSFPYTEEYFKGQTDKTVNFTIEPFDNEAIRVLGNFYSHGTYGGVGCLPIETIE